MRDPKIGNSNNSNRIGSYKPEDIFDIFALVTNLL